MSVTLLVRHGQASFGLGNYDQLSPMGEAQIGRLGAVLAERGVAVDRVVSGGLQRQRESAQLVNERLGGLPHAIDERWNEYDYEPLIRQIRPAYESRTRMVADLARTGNPAAAFQDVLDEALAHWASGVDAWPVPGGAAGAAANPQSDFAGYAARVAAALSDVSEQPGITVVASSAGTICAAVAPLLGIAPSGWPDLQRVVVNGSLTKVVRGRRGLSLISFNEHGHLEGIPGLETTYR